MSQFVIGIDIGTTQTKGVVIDADGGIVKEAAREATLISRRPTWAEEDPRQWWDNTVEIVRELLDDREVRQGRVHAVGVSGMVPAMVLLGPSGEPLRPSIQQNDARSGREVQELKTEFGDDEFFRRTGGSLNQQVVAPKMRWLRRHEPEVVESLATLFGSYDYVNFMLTGERTVEQNWALESGLLDVHDADWADDLIALATLSRDQLPRIVSSTEVVGSVTRAAAAATGLPEGTPVVGGAADHVASAFVTTAYANGDLVVKFGGAGDVLYSQSELVTDKRLFIDHHIVPGHYYLNGCMATSGSLVKWFVQNFASDAVEAAERDGLSPYQFLDLAAANVPVGSGGLVVLPYFLGEKTPLHDPNARGTILGLGLHHGQAHVYRAILEAVAYGFRHHVDVLDERELPVTRVLAADGGAKSDVWMQITANVLGRPVQRLASHPGSSLGAAFVAGMGVGVFDAWTDIERYVELSRPFEPEEAAVDVYDRLYPVYRTAYERLKDVFPTLTEIEANA